MKTLLHFLAGALFIGASLPALPGNPVGAMHPEESIPDNLPRMTSSGPYDEFIKQVQQKLHEQRFDAGPVNGDFGSKTQAALAQFQLSQSLPVSGSLASWTLNALGVVAGLAPSAASTGASDAVHPPAPRSP